MSMIVDVIKRRGRPPVPSGPEKAPPVAAKLASAKAELATTIEEYSDAALAEATDDPDGASRLVVVKDRRAQLEQRVADLEVAHAAAVQSDQRMFAAQRAGLYSAQISAVKRHLRDRDGAARQLVIALENANEAWRRLCGASDAAMRANPIGGLWPEPSLCDRHKLGEAVRKHTRRIGGLHPATKIDPSRPPFPGTEANGIGEHNPQNCPDLLEEIARANRYVLATLEGRKLSVAAVQVPAVVEPAANPAPAIQQPRVDAPADDPHEDTSREPWDPAIHAPLEWAAMQKAAAIVRGEPAPPVEEQPDAEEAALLRRVAAMDAE